jgi:hypothetical protein
MNPISDSETLSMLSRLITATAVSEEARVKMIIHLLQDKLSYVDEQFFSPIPTDEENRDAIYEKPEGELSLEEIDEQEEIDKLIDEFAEQFVERKELIEKHLWVEGREELLILVEEQEKERKALYEDQDADRKELYVEQVALYEEQEKERQELYEEQEKERQALYNKQAEQAEQAEQDALDERESLRELNEAPTVLLGGQYVTKKTVSIIESLSPEDMRVFPNRCVSWSMEGERRGFGVSERFKFVVRAKSSALARVKIQNIIRIEGFADGFDKHHRELFQKVCEDGDYYTPSKLELDPNPAKTGLYFRDVKIGKVFCANINTFVEFAHISRKKCPDVMFMSDF